jgi:hypothetical protein
MLSVAKHLLFLVENKQKQIPLPPRRDRDDNPRGLSSSLFLKNVEKKRPCPYAFQDSTAHQNLPG